MQELGNSMPLAEGMVDAEAGADQSDLSKNCLNCGEALKGKYCYRCGQKNIPRRQTMGELFENFLGSFFSYESKFFRTIKYLLLKPGFLTMEYNAGRRERYYHPARMYVFISFVFFLLYFSLPDTDEEQVNKVQTDGEMVATKKGRNRSFQIGDNPYENRKDYDSAQLTLSEEDRDNWIIRQFNYRSYELDERYKDNEDEFSRQVGDSFAENSPKVFFFLLPIFALLLKLLYIRRDFFYSEHLVMSIYFYNFFFAIGIMTLLLELIPWLDWIGVVTFIIVGLYLLLAMKWVYKQSWRKTILKFFILSLVFFICVSIGLLANLIITVMLI
ncbi:MAG: DUF3667 domain-containing protein [Cyclobacteriaceae bacterium]